MPVILGWAALAENGTVVQREEAPGRQVPADTRLLDLCTNVMRVRALVKKDRGEELRVFTRRSQSLNVVSGTTSDTSTPCVELKVGGAVVRLFVYDDEVVISTEDICGPIEDLVPAPIELGESYLGTR